MKTFLEEYGIVVIAALTTMSLTLLIYIEKLKLNTNEATEEIETKKSHP